MKQTPLQQLTTLIQASNPELMTLGVGCEMKCKGINELTLTCFAIKKELYRFVDQKATAYAWYKIDLKESFEIKSFEIIGKPPTLVDVRNWIITLRRQMPIEYTYNKLLLDWNDSIYLRDQSPELINFLINLNK